MQVSYARVCTQYQLICIFLQPKMNSVQRTYSVWRYPQVFYLLYAKMFKKLREVRKS